ncbi:GNAT family protein [uncultured Paraglaciecola sp.]|uniref:GNAT family N-acetyltransferase n=1 Tax=uncultured Paraglaciecola sp. TaxID=1765024 RepID=UPI0025D7D1D0|nr:GNAT family protein [uncultured Paraglaciecola sp.]
MKKVDKYHDFPLCGKRITLKKFSKKDITPEYIAWLNSKVIMKHSHQRLSVHNAMSCMQYVDSFCMTDNLFLSIYVEELLVGTMTAYISIEEKIADLGVLVGDRMWGKGIGYEAWQTLMDYLLLQEFRVTAGTVPSNIAMKKIAMRSGMKSQGEDYLEEVINGVTMSTLYSLYVAP